MNKLKESNLINHKVCRPNVAIELEGGWKNVSYVALFVTVRDYSAILEK
jgi:hypothetical protein